MNKLGIWALVIATAFMIGIFSANPVVEAVGGWKAAVDDLQNQIDNLEPSEQIYEVSVVSVIPESSTTGSFVMLRCLEGDMFLNAVSQDSEPRLLIELDPSLDTTNLSITTTAINIITENIEGVHDSNQRIIGYDTRARQSGATQMFEIPVTISGFCLSLSP